MKILYTLLINTILLISLNTENFIEIGALPTLHNSELQTTKHIYYTTLQLEYIKNNILLGTDVTNYIIKSDDDWTFSPFHINYGVWIEYTLSDFTVGIEHRCSHDVNSLGMDDPVLATEASWDRIYFKINL